MSTDKYILNEQGEPVKEPDLLKWGRSFEISNRIVKQEMIGDVQVSTVFLGLDHNWASDGPPVLWESMVFGGPHDSDWMDRCSGSREQAQAMHERMVARVKADDWDAA